MRKNILEKIKVIKATAKYKEKAKNKDLERSFILKAERVNIKGEDTIILNFFKCRDLLYEFYNPIYRTFMNKDKYLTQMFAEDGSFVWKNTSLDRLDYLLNLRKIQLIDKGSEKALKGFFKKLKYNVKDDEQLVRDIFILQYDILKKKRMKIHQKEIDSIDIQMQKFKKLPKYFARWIDKEALYNSSYIFYKYKPNKKELDGYCTCCKKDIKVIGAKHNERGICPNCKHPITYKAEGKSKCIADYIWVELLDLSDTGELISRVFSVSKSYYTHYRNPNLSITEVKRGVFDLSGEKVAWYEYTYFKNTPMLRWCNDIGKIRWQYTVLYDRNLDILDKTVFKHCAIKEYIKKEKVFMFNVCNYLMTYIKHNAIEHFVKNGLYKLIDELLFHDFFILRDFDLNKSKLTEILGVNKQELRIIKSIDASSREISILKKYRLNGYCLDVDTLKYISKLYNWENLLSVLKYTSLNKAIKYIKIPSDGYVDSRKIDIWKDYLEFCKVLKIDLKKDLNLFPRDLKLKHDRYADLIKAKKNELCDIAIRDMYEEVVKKYTFEKFGLRIVVPRNAQDIIDEGGELKHCVGTYIGKVAKGNCIILFIRESNNIEKSYFTMEVHDQRVLQCKGYENKEFYTDERVNKFIDEFKRCVLEKEPKVIKDLKIIA